MGMCLKTGFISIEYAVESKKTALNYDEMACYSLITLFRKVFMLYGC